jgi:muramoyltetrapeptide carboxypeptidase
VRCSWVQQNGRSERKVDRWKPIALLAHLTGTDSDVKTKGHILFLEDVGEYLYNTDRLLVQMKRSGKLEKLAGLIIGGFTDVKDTERPFGKTAYEIIYEHVGEYKYPDLLWFPCKPRKRKLCIENRRGA